MDFRQFIGIITNPNQQHRTKKRSADEEPDISDDDDDDEDDIAPEGMGAAAASFDQTQFEANIVEVDDEETAAERHRDALLDRFLDKPDHAMKVFLSSYFSAKGMLWDPAKLRDAPILMRFFIDYLLKRGVLPEASKALERAHAVTELAKVELPATSDMSKVLSPEKFGELCKRAWSVTFTAKNDRENTTFEREPLPEKGDPDTMHVESLQVDLNGHTVDFSSATPEDALSGSGWDGVKTGGAGWGDAAASGWDTHVSVQPEIEDWSQTGTPERPLSEWLGGVDPSFLKQYRSELSTRRLIRILPPNPGTTGPASQLATLIMGKWHCCPKDFGYPQSLLNEGDSDWIPGEEEISVFVHPDVAEKVLPGFGLQCVWVHVREEKKSKGKKKSQSWWYVESHRAAFMTYWTVDELEEGVKKY
ncbi:hypothetical protein EXIGLDRAFT_841056 [Exidia glandulosa HHB12029]|uniref:Uncharacterized protein n=1 Tax=Exidia glandulosa HHB12029 TaxID=1314781 RepID=A0A165E461_EXIGL|nr:hypothetical protein EXIGLDRAFT_841056 [Exidia glandulosa HHB12029]